MALDLPTNTEGEVTLLGSGGGYGESCVIHLGNQNWVVVDSCINPNTGKSIPLEYLVEIGVDIASSVKIIISTHWHDDHIKGIAELFKAATSSKFYCARATDRMKFLYFLSMDYKKIKDSISNCSTIEFNKCIDILEKREQKVPAFAQINTLICRYNIGELESSIFALSPSDYTLAEFDKEVGTLITEFGDPGKKIVYQSPNNKSIVLFVKLASHRALLGSDLEVMPTEDNGWLNVLKNRVVIDKKASLFKLSHHGSENGHHRRIWAELLESNPVAKLTPWNRNTKLPEMEMLKEFGKRSSKLYMTSRVISDKAKERDRDIKKMIKKLNDTLMEVKFNKGIIRSRIDLLDDAAHWRTDLFEHAFDVKKELSI